MKIRQITTCQTCRTRKLACDGITPACSQCALSGRTCPGYVRNLIFRPPITAGQKSATARAAERQRTSRRSKTNDAEKHPHQKLSLPSPPLKWPLLHIVWLLIQNFSPPGILNGLCFVPGASGISAPRVCGAWVEALPEIARDGRAEDFLLPCVKTLAISILSRGRNGRAPVSDALAAHTVAAAALRSGLQGEVGSSSNMFSAAAMCLYMSEMMLPTSRASATIHAKGIGDLLQLQHPGFYSSGAGHQLFVGFRPVLFLNSLLSRQNLFLAEERWLTAPFSISSPAPIQELFSKLITLPATLEALDNLQTLPAAQADAAASIAVGKLENSLYELVNMGEALKNDDQVLFPEHLTENYTAILFPSLSAANLFIHIWAFHIVCARHISQLAASFPFVRGQVKACLEKLISAETVIQLSCLILRSLEFLTLDTFKLSGAASTTLPLHVIGDVLKDQGRDCKELLYWHRRVLQMYSSRGYQYLIEHVPRHSI